MPRKWVRVDEYRESYLYQLNEMLYTSTNNLVTTRYPKKNGVNYAMVPIHWVVPTWQKSFSYEGGTAPVGKMVKNYYDPAHQGGTQYGNLTGTQEWEYNGTVFVPYRGSETSFYPTATTDTTRYLVGLPGESKQFICPADGCFASNTTLLADVQYLYDGSSNPGASPTAGKLTGERHLLRWTDPVNKTGPLYSDVDYAYDAWGNRVSVTQYTLEGTQSTLAKNLVQRSLTCYGVTDTPVGCVDDGYHTYPLWQKNALDQGTGYVYNYALGLPTQVTDPNQVIDPNHTKTQADYDVYGRLWKIARPGDTLNAPTIEISYHDDAIPFWTQATQKLDGGLTFSVRKFYNGLGELIQTQQVGGVLNDPACGGFCTVVTDHKTEYVNGVKTTFQTVPYAVAGTPPGYISPPSTPWQNATVTTYDILGRPLRIKAPGQTDANSQRFNYGVDGNRLKTTTTDPGGNATSSWQDIWGRTVKVNPALGPSLEYGYDAANHLTAVRQIPQGGGPAFATTTIEYDVAGRKLNMTDPDMGKWYYAYDALSNLTRQTDAKSQRICLYYDGLNRLKGKHYRGDDTCPTVNPTLNVSYSYDANAWGIGRRTGMTDVSGTTAWSYDNRGRMASETKTITGVDTYTTTWTYTNADQVKTMTYPKSGEMVTSNYLPQGTLNSLTSSLGSTYLSSASVDAAGRPAVFNLGNGTQTVYTYNTWAETDGKQSGRLKKLQSGTPESLIIGATPSLQSFQYTYDWNGNITDITQKVGSQSVETPHYEYDAINRLTNVTYSGNPTTYETTTYDANTGNLATKAGKALGYGAQAANCPDSNVPAKVHAAISLDGTTNTYCYDPNGNMTRRKIGANTYTLSYDPENRLTQISGGGGPVFDYVYDGDGQRVLVKQTSNGQTDKTIYIGGYFEVFIKASYTPPTTPPALNCGIRHCAYLPLGILPNNPLAATGQVWKSYYSTGSGQAMRIQDNTNTGGGSGLFWLYADHLGSTTLTASLNGLGGDLISTLSYTAWGETRANASSGITPTSIRYTGQRDAEAGLYFYNASWQSGVVRYG